MEFPLTLLKVLWQRQKKCLVRFANGKVKNKNKKTGGETVILSYSLFGERSFTSTVVSYNMEQDLIVWSYNNDLVSIYYPVYNARHLINCMQKKNVRMNF